MLHAPSPAYYVAVMIGDSGISCNCRFDSAVAGAGVMCLPHPCGASGVCVCSAFGTVGSLLAFKFAGADENGANKGTDQLYTCDTVGDVQLSPCS